MGLQIFKAAYRLGITTLELSIFNFEFIGVKIFWVKIKIILPMQRTLVGPIKFVSIEENVECMKNMKKESLLVPLQVRPHHQNPHQSLRPLLQRPKFLFL